MELNARTTSGWTPAATPDEIKPGSARSILFFGPDEGGLFEYARMAAGTGDTERHDARSCDVNSVISSLSAGSLFGGGTTVILENAGDAARARIETMLAAPFADEARLIVMAGELKATSKLRKLYKDSKDLIGVPLYLMRGSEIGAFARSMFSQVNLSVSRDAGPALADRLSGDRAMAARACETVALHAIGQGRRSVTLDDVRAVLDTVDEDALTAPFDQALLGNPGSALAGLHTRMKGGESAIKLLRIFAARAFRLHDLLASNLPPKDAVAKARPPVFWAERDRMIRLVGAVSPNKISRILQRIDRTEYLIIENGAPDLPALSTLLLDLAHHKTWKATT